MLAYLAASLKDGDDGRSDAAGGNNLAVAVVCDFAERHRVGPGLAAVVDGAGPDVWRACPALAGPDREREAGGVATPLPPAAAAILAAGAKLESDSFLYVPSLLAGGSAKVDNPGDEEKKPTEGGGGADGRGLGPSRYQQLHDMLDNNLTTTI